jgi:hypothetical protein
MRHVLLGCLTALVALVAIFAIVVSSSLPRPTTPDELRAIPEMDLHYPRATEVSRVDRPGRYTFLMKTPTEVRTVYRSDAAPRAIEAWFASELTARGWVREPDFLTGDRTRSFHRWCHRAIAAELWLTIEEGGADGKPSPPDSFSVSLRSEVHGESWTCRPR